MVIDFNNCFLRNPDILADICHHRVLIANLVMSAIAYRIDPEDQNYYESEIRHYKCYDV